MEIKKYHVFKNWLHLRIEEGKVSLSDNKFPKDLKESELDSEFYMVQDINYDSLIELRGYIAKRFVSKSVKENIINYLLQLNVTLSHLAFYKDTELMRTIEYLKKVPVRNVFTIGEEELNIDEIAIIRIDDEFKIIRTCEFLQYENYGALCRILDGEDVSRILKDGNFEEGKIKFQKLTSLFSKMFKENLIDLKCLGRCLLYDETIKK